MERSDFSSKKESPPPTLSQPSGMVGRLGALVPKRAIRVVTAVAVAGLFAVSAANAAIITTGDIEPGDPTTWIGGYNQTHAYVGNAANGSLTINGGSQVVSFQGFIGYNAGVTGQVSITGPAPIGALTAP